MSQGRLREISRSVIACVSQRHLCILLCVTDMSVCCCMSVAVYTEESLCCCVLRGVFMLLCT